jgi:hypothetical protein
MAHIDNSYQAKDDGKSERGQREHQSYQRRINNDAQRSAQGEDLQQIRDLRRGSAAGANNAIS